MKFVHADDLLLTQLYIFCYLQNLAKQHGYQLFHSFLISKNSFHVFLKNVMARIFSDSAIFFLHTSVSYPFSFSNTTFYWWNSQIVVFNNYMLHNSEIADPAGIYLLKVNNRNRRTRYGICSKLTIKTPQSIQNVAFFTNIASRI